MYRGLVVYLLMFFIDETAWADQLVRGVVIDNNMENPSVGAYLHIEENETRKRVFVLYTPSPHEFVAVGDQVEIQGAIVQEIGGVKVSEYVLNTATPHGFVRIQNRIGKTVAAQ